MSGSLGSGPVPAAQPGTGFPLPDLGALPGVADAVRAAESALQRLHRLPANLRGWPRTAAAAAVRSARLSAALEASSPAGTADPRTGAPAGALRVAAELPELVALWGRAPLQVLARLHVLAASGLEPPLPPDQLGRPTGAPGAAALAAVARLALDRPWPVVITAAVLQAELVVTRPFGSADGVVARAASRLTLMSAGLDPRGLSVPEVGLGSDRAGYLASARRFFDGGDPGRAGWLLLFAGALAVGAEEGSRLSVPPR